MSIEISSVTPPAGKEKPAVIRKPTRKRRSSNAIDSIVLRIDAIRDGMERRPYVLGIAGCGDREAGKVAASFAASSAELNMGRVVLVQCKRLRKAKKAGLLDFVHGEKSLEEVVGSSDVEGLDLLALGNGDGRRVAPDMMQNAIKELRSNYDLVVLQLPPIDGTAESLMFNRFVDSVALVVSSGKTRARDADAALQVLEESGVSVAGVILNNARSVLPKWIDRWF